MWRVVSRQGWDRLGLSWFGRQHALDCPLCYGIGFAGCFGSRPVSYTHLDVYKRQGLRDHVVVVTRWYGGVHLGGDRFAHVVTSVRAYLAALG